MKNIFLLSIAIVALSSCATQRKTLAERCAESFPSRDTTIYVSIEKTDTLYLAGYDQTDTIVVDCPPATDTIRQTITRTVTFPARAIPVKYTVRDTIVAPIDSAIRAANNELKKQLTALTISSKETEAKLKEARRHTSTAWLPWLIVGILLAFLIWLTFKKKR